MKITKICSIVVLSSLAIGCTNVVDGVVAPVARAGLDLSARPGTEVALDGSASFSPGNPGASLSFDWRVALAPSPEGTELLATNTAAPSFKASAPGLYVVRLVVSDAGVESAPAYVNVRVTARNLAPIANAGPDLSGAPDEVIILDGSKSSDPEGLPLVYAWTQINGPTATVTDADTASPSLTIPRTLERLTFELTVTDSRGLTATDEVIVIVEDVPPVAIIEGPPSGSAQEQGFALMDGTSSYDPNGQPITEYRWTYSSNLAVFYDDPAAAKPQMNLPGICGSPPPVVLSLVVTAGGTRSPSTSYSLAVVDSINEAPTANAGSPVSGGEIKTITLDASGSDDCNGDVLNYTWSQLSGPPVSLSDNTVVDPNFTSPSVFDATTMTFQVVVDDGRGGSDTDTVTVTIQNDVNEPPVAFAGVDQSAVVTNRVNLSGTGTDPNPSDTVLQYQWQQLTGTTVTLSGATTPTPTFLAPSNPGTLTFGLTVSDDEPDQSAQDVVTITVVKGPPVLANSTITVADTNIVADGSSSTVVTVTVKDVGGNPLAGQTVVIQATDGTMLGSVSDNGDGTYTQSLQSSTTAGNVNVAFTVAGNVAPNTASVVFDPGVPSGTFTLTATPQAIEADAISTSSVTSSTITDANGNTVADGHLFTVTATDGTITTADEDTGLAGIQVSTSGGVISFTIKSSTTKGTATLTATLPGGGASGTGTVQFIPGLPTGTITLTPNPTTATADGTTPITYTSDTIRDSQGNAVADGTKITIAVAGGVSGTITASDADAGTPGIQVTTTAGAIVFNVAAGTTAGDMIVTADSVQGSASGSATVPLTPGPPDGTIALFSSQPDIVVSGTTSTDPSSVTITSGSITDANGNTVVDGTLVTVVVNNGGTITTADADGANGHQIAVSGGTITFDVLSGTTDGTMTVSVTANTATGTIDVTVYAGPPTAISFNTGPRTIVAGQCSLVAVVILEDMYGNFTQVTSPYDVDLTADTGMTFFRDSACTNVVTTRTIPTGAASVGFYFTDTIPGNPVVTATSSTTPSINASQTQTVQSAATKLAFNTPARTFIAGTCSGLITVQAQDTGGAAAAVDGATTVNLSATNLTFYSDPACGSAVTSVTIADKGTDASFYVTGTLAGAQTATAAATGLTSAAQDETIDPAAPATMFFTTPARTVVAGACSAAITISFRDQYANVTAATGAMTLNLTADTGATFHSDAGCTSSTTSLAVVANDGTKTFYMKDTVPGTPTVTVTDAGAVLPTITQTETVTSAAAKLAYVTSPQAVAAGACSAIITIEAQDSGSSPAAVDGATTVALTGAPTYYSDAACTNVITSVVIADKGTQASFYASHTATGAHAMTATDAAAGLTSAAQNLTIFPAAPTDLAFITPAQTIVASNCSGATQVGVKDAYGNFSTASGAITIDLTASSGMTFYSDASCTTGITSIVMADATASVTFYFMDTVAGTPTITAADQAGTLGSAVQQQTIQSNLAAQAPANVTGRFPWDSISLTGARTGGTPTFSFAWSVTAGPAGHAAKFGAAACPWPGLATCVGQTVDFWPDLAGTYTITMVVTDGNSDVASDTMTVTVNAFTTKTPNGIQFNGNENTMRRLAVMPSNGHVGAATDEEMIIYRPDLDSFLDISCGAGTVTSDIELGVDGSGNPRFYMSFSDSTSFTRVDSYGNQFGEDCTGNTDFNVTASLSGTPTAVHGLAQNSATGDLWVATDLDITVLAQGAAATTTDNAFTSENNADYGAIEIDHEGNLFVAHLLEGWHRTPLPFVAGSAEQDLKGSPPTNDVITDIVRGAKIPASNVNEIWFATDALGIFRITDVTAGSTTTQYTTAEGLPSNQVTQMVFEDTSGDVWAATTGGVARYKRDVDAWVAITDGTSGLCTSVLGIATDDSAPGTRGRRLYVGCANNLRRLDGTP